MEKIFFVDQHNNKLCGVLSNPSQDLDKPIIILCHGFSSSKDSSTYVRLQEELNQKNISTFRFDFFGHGESAGDFAELTISKAVNNLLGAINYSKIGLISSSFGGMVSLVTATQTQDLFVLGLKCPVSDYLGKLIAQHTKNKIKEWEEKGFLFYHNKKLGKLKLNYSFFEDSKNYDNYYEQYKNITIPTLIVHGDKDVTVPIEQSHKAKEAILNCELEVIPGADHYFREKDYFERVINHLTEFIIKNI